MQASVPALAQVRTVQDSSRTQAGPGYDATMEVANINAIQAEMKVLNAQLDEVRRRASQLDQAEISIMEAKTPQGTRRNQLQISTPPASNRRE